MDMTMSASSRYRLTSEPDIGIYALQPLVRAFRHTSSFLLKTHKFASLRHVSILCTS